jgi:SAM-dependent methyltransferase
MAATGTEPSRKATMTKSSRQIRRAFRHPGKAFRYGIRKVRQALFWDRYYETVRDPKARARVDMDPTIQANVVRELKAGGFEVVDFRIDLPDLQSYLARARYDRFPDYCGTDIGRLPEKTLEHYLAAKLLELSPQDVYIDVATSDSPTPEIYHELYGCKVYRQDLTYPYGVHGNKIGGDAANMPVPDGFATRMSMHCSFEHFEGDSDMRFIREVGRVLRPGGKLCIVPFYLRNRYVVQTDPCVYSKGSVQFEDDAFLCCTKGWGHRHGRHYDVTHLKTRIVPNLDDLHLTIFVVGNEKAVSQSCYVKFIGLFEKRQTAG